jgi:hypothetical protein
VRFSLLADRLEMQINTILDLSFSSGRCKIASQDAMLADFTHVAHNALEPT